MRFWTVLLGLAFLGCTLTASAQNLPNYLDPGAREIVPDTAKVPAIRFLTTPDFPPLNYRDKSGALVGFDIDLAHAICTELAIACTIQSWPWDQAGQALADNQGDALIAGLAITPENGRKFDFSSIYLGFPARFVTARAGVVSFNARSLSGKTIAVRKGTSHAQFARRYLVGVRIKLFDTELAALNALAAGEVDAYFGDGLRASFWLNEHPKCCAFAGQPYFRPDLFGDGLAIAVAAGHDDMRRALNAALARLKRKGTMDELYLRWFPVSFY